MTISEHLKKQLLRDQFEDVQSERPLNEFQMKRDLGDLGTLIVWSVWSDQGGLISIRLFNAEDDQNIYIAECDNETAVLDFVRITLKFSRDISERKYLEERLKAGCET